MRDVPERCRLCDTAIPAGKQRCPGCGKVYGEANRCPSCHAIAAVRQLQPGSYVCAACGAPRRRNPGTPLDSDFAGELTRSATRSRVLSYVLLPIGGVLAFSGSALLATALAFMNGVLETIFGGLGAGGALFGTIGLFFGLRARKRARQLWDKAVEARLLLTVGRATAGITAADAAREVRSTTAAVDAELTELAKRGRVEMDVDDAGTVRYRVADDEALSFDEPPPSARARQHGPGA